MNFVKHLMFFIFLFSTIIMAQEVSSKFNLKFYGFVKYEAIYDNTELAVGDWMLYARPGNDARSEQDIFTMNARHTRVGLKFTGPEVGEGKVNALVEVDFAGGFPNSSTAARQANLRLRHAWIEIDYSTWALRFGQDWALIAGPFPNTTSFVVGAGKGNLWMRYPQAKLVLGKLKSSLPHFPQTYSNMYFSLNRGERRIIA